MQKTKTIVFTLRTDNSVAEENFNQLKRETVLVHLLCTVIS